MLQTVRPTLLFRDDSRARTSLCATTLKDAAEQTALSAVHQYYSVGSLIISNGVFLPLLMFGGLLCYRDLVGNLPQIIAIDRAGVVSLAMATFTRT